MKLVDKLVYLQIINKEDTDIYEYSVNILKSYIFFSLIIIVANYFTSNYITTIVFLSLFFSLRRYCGGLHLEKTSTCMIFSIVLTLTVPCLCSFFYIYPIQLIFLQIIFSFLLFLMPIIDTPQKTVTDCSKKKYKKISIYIILFYLFLNIISIYLNLEKISMIILLTIICSYISVFLGYIKYKNHKKSN